MGDLEALAPALGDALRFHDPVAVDGVPVGATLAPPDAPALAAALARLGAAGCAAIPRGAGTQLGLGNPPRRADCFVSLEHLAAVHELDASEGVCRAGAGTPLAALRARAREAGWELPLDDADRGGTLGGALASAALAPRAQGFGRPRDAVLGCEVALADGSLTRCGGRVVKNVTGYDMAKLYTGSLGSLGVITAAWLRLRPAPQAVRTLQGPGLPDADACRLGLEAARCPTARSCLLVDEAGGLRPTVELAGDAASVDRDAEGLRARGLHPAGEAAHTADAARRFGDPADALRLVVSFRPTGLAACVAELRAAGAGLLVLPGLGIACARGPQGAASALFAAASRAARAGGGRTACEWAPADTKRGRDVFAATPAEAALARALKERFDPRGVLNPGRQAGCV